MIMTHHIRLPLNGHSPFQSLSQETKGPLHVPLEILHNLWVGARSPGGMIVHLIYEVSGKPEYLEPLQKEVQEVGPKHG